MGRAWLASLRGRKSAAVPLSRPSIALPVRLGAPLRRALGGCANRSQILPGVSAHFVSDDAVCVKQRNRVNEALT